MRRGSRRALELWRSSLGVQVHELRGIFKRQVRHLASGILGEPERTALDCPAEADLGAGLRRQERMFVDGLTFP
jgi:hypothetical protein